MIHDESQQNNNINYNQRRTKQHYSYNNFDE